MEPTRARLIGITGLPGEGKSHFARSCAKLGKTLAACADPKEIAFYAAGGVTAELFVDLEWRPLATPATFEATGFRGLLKWMDAAAKSDAAFVVLDPVSEVSDLAMHETLRIHQTGDPGDVPHGRAYTGHDTQIKALLNEARRCIARGKTVVCVFHGKMKELEGAGDAKKAKSMSGELEWTFDEQLLPVLNTSFRQTIHSAFDIWAYTKPSGFGPGRRYCVTLVTDAVRPAKHSVTLTEDAKVRQQTVNFTQIGNTMEALLTCIAS